MMRPVSAQPFCGANYDRSVQMEQSISRLYREGPQNSSKKLSKRPAAGRLMPQLMIHDKQRLYSEAINLKQMLHELRNENTKLKTRLAFVDKENIRLNNYIVSGDSASGVLCSKGFMNSGEKDSSSMIINLKKLLKQARDQIEDLEEDNATLKKTVKYTKISELEIERKALADEAGRLKAIVDQLIQNRDEQIDFRNQIASLTHQLRARNEENENLIQTNSYQQQTIQYLENKLKETEKNLQTRESKIVKDLKVAKLKIQDNLRKQEIYQNYIATLEQRNSENAQTVARLSTAVARASTISKPSFRRNMKLSQQPDAKQLADISQLRKSESHQSNFNPNKPARIPSAKPHDFNSHLAYKNQMENSGEMKKQSPIIPAIPIGSEESSKAATVKSQKSLKKQPTDKVSANPASSADPSNCSSTHQIISKVPSQREYPADFNADNEEKDDIDKYNEDFQDSQNKEQILFQKEDKNQQEDGLWSNIITEFAELMQRKLKAQRYPIEELISDTRASCPATITVMQLDDLLQHEPFNITNLYTTALIGYLFFNTTNLTPDERQEKWSTMISIEDFIRKLQQLIKPFKLIPEEEEQMLASEVSELLIKHWNSLLKKLEPLKDEFDSVPASVLKNALKELGFAEEHIELMINDLAVECLDLDHLEYMGLAEVYIAGREDLDEEYGPDNFNRQQTKTIKEQYEESSMSNERHRRIVGSDHEQADPRDRAHSFSMRGDQDDDEEPVLSNGLV